MIPPRLSASAMFWWGIGLVAFFLITEFATGPIYQEAFPTAVQAQIARVLQRLMPPIANLALIIGCGLLVGSLVVRALRPDEGVSKASTGREGRAARPL
jgi:hypothetical protein